MEGPGADRRDDLVRLGGGEDEPQVRRGLLDQLEQGIGGLVGQLVGLVDDVDLVSTRRRRVDGLLAQLPGIIDAAVRGSVQFHDIHGAGAVGGQLHAAAALPAGLGGRPLLAVERAGQDARGRGLAAPTWAGEQVGVVRPARLERTLERLGHVLLADHLSQRARPIGPVERQCHVAHPSGDRRQVRPASTVPSSSTPGDNSHRCNYADVIRAGRPARPTARHQQQAGPSGPRSQARPSPGPGSPPAASRCRPHDGRPGAGSRSRRPPPPAP